MITVNGERTKSSGRAATAGELAAVVGAEVRRPEAPVGMFRVDSREVAAGDCFVCVVGERVDGHAFAGEACARGATCVLVDGNRIDEVARCVGGAAVVGKPGATAVELLQEYARHRARAFSGRVIGVTGSAGKTTARELIAAALGGLGPVLKPDRNLNTEVGLPLTVANARGGEAAWVLEYGARKRGDIAALTSVVAPRWAVITSVGHAHLGVMGGEEAIYREKTSIVVPGATELVFANADGLDVERLRHDLPGVEIVTAGSGERCEARVVEYRPLVSGSAVTVRLSGDGTVGFRLAVPGRHVAALAALALAVAARAGVEPAEAAQALEGFSGVPMRLEFVEKGGYLFLNDAYNANPASMRAAIRVLAEHPSDARRAAVIGDMLELGDAANELHRDVGRALAEAGIPVVIYVGAHADEVGRGYREVASGGVFVAASSVEEAARALADRVPRGSVVLLKASRAIGLERVLDHV